MSLKYTLCIGLVLACLALAGCGDRAKELYETAQFEELQQNKPHAIKLYEELLQKYPDSEYGKKARERLDSLKENP